MKTPKKLKLIIAPWATKSAYYESYTRFTTYTLIDEKGGHVAKGSTHENLTNRGYNSNCKGYSNYVKFLEANNLKKDDVEIIKHSTSFDSGNYH